MGPCKFDGGTFIWLSLARLWPGLAQLGKARLGQRRRAGGRVGRIGDDLTKIDFLLKKCSFRLFFIISGPSRPQKWIQLEILRNTHPGRGLEIKIKTIS